MRTSHTPLSTNYPARPIIRARALQPPLAPPPRVPAAAARPSEPMIEFRFAGQLSVPANSMEAVVLVLAVVGSVVVVGWLAASA